MKKSRTITGSRYLIIKQVTKVVRESIERLDTPENANQLEAEILRARKGNIFDDRTAQEMLDNIAEIRRIQGWN